MTALPEKDNDPAPQDKSASRLATLLLSGGLLAGGMIGLYSVTSRNGPIPPVALVFMVALGAASMLCAALSMRELSARMVAAQRIGPRTLAARRLMVGSFLLGTGFAVVLALAHRGDAPPIELFVSDSTIARSAALALVGACGLSLVLSWFWQVKADEHEAAANNFGALVGIYAYFTLSIAWWLAWRGGMTIAPDGKAIFVIVILAWAAGWLWKRYR